MVSCACAGPTAAGLRNFQQIDVFHSTAEILMQRLEFYVVICTAATLQDRTLQAVENLLHLQEHQFVRSLQQIEFL
jgi:hypothetical protein